MLDWLDASNKQPFSIFTVTSQGWQYYSYGKSWCRKNFCWKNPWETFAEGSSWYWWWCLGEGVGNDSCRKGKLYLAAVKNIHYRNKLNNIWTWSTVGPCFVVGIHKYKSIKQIVIFSKSMLVLGCKLNFKRFWHLVVSSGLWWFCWSRGASIVAVLSQQCCCVFEWVQSNACNSHGSHQITWDCCVLRCGRWRDIESSGCYESKQDCWTEWR